MSKSDKAWYSVKNEGGVPEIKIYGYITSYSSEDTVNYARFQNELRLLLASNDEVIIRFHCYGGSMFDGLPIYDLIRNCGKNVTTITEGMAASMGGVIFQAGTKRKMHKHARLMIHRPQGGQVGESDDLRNYADLLDSMEEDLVGIFMKCTGKSKKEVKGWMQPKQEKWITATEALKLGLCDEIVEDGEAVVPENVWGKGKSPEAVWAICNGISEESIVQKIDMKKPIIGVLNAYKVKHNLTESNADTEYVEVVENALKEREFKIEELTKKVNDLEGGKVKDLVQNAVSAGKIAEAERADYEALAASNYEAAKRVLEKMEGRKDVNASLNRGKGVPAGGSEGADVRAGWTYRDYETKDPKALAAMRQSEPEKWQQLFDAFYGADAD